VGEPESGGGGDISQPQAADKSGVWFLISSAAVNKNPNAKNQKYNKYGELANAA
jgi:hypothetical protein